MRTSFLFLVAGLLLPPTLSRAGESVEISPGSAPVPVPVPAAAPAPAAAAAAPICKNPPPSAPADPSPYVEVAQALDQKVTGNDCLVGCKSSDLQGLMRPVPLISHGRARGKSCANSVQRLAQTRSPYRTMDIPTRASAVTQVAAPAAAALGLDPLVFACIAARETHYLEPLTIGHCGHAQRGLGQTTADTFENMLTKGVSVTKAEEQAWREKVQANPDLPMRVGNGFVYFQPTAALAKYRSMGVREMYDSITESPALQIQLMAFTLWEKGTETGSFNYANILLNYNGNKRRERHGRTTVREEYSASVNRCRVCMPSAMDPKGNVKNAKAVSGCLNRVFTPSTSAPDIDREFQDYMHPEVGAMPRGEPDDDMGDDQ